MSAFAFWHGQRALAAKVSFPPFASVIQSSGRPLLTKRYTLVAASGSISTSAAARA
jgi:hypothetical protein